MIPRLHKRGTSFKGACGYILHDAQKTSRDRVLWNETQNLISKADDAWFEMFATARDQAALKEQSGQSARGRKNTKPVLHLTLSWAIGENPTPEHMRETARSCLNALGLGDHQALLAAHSDKEHLHVHMVVNTIHPETGLTAPLKYSKERLSRWAEAYERKHGIHCEERIKNNERRKDVVAAREADPSRDFVPVKHEQTRRAEWFDRKVLLDRMKELRAEIRPLLPQPAPRARKALTDEHRTEREGLYQSTVAAVEQARSSVFDRYRPQWRELYRAHKAEARHLQRAATHPFERAVFVYSQRDRLGNGKPLTFRQMFQLIIKPERLLQRVEAIQEKERRTLARSEKTEKKQISERLWLQYKERIDTVKERQTEERFGLVKDREAQLRTIVTFDLAKEALRADRQPANDSRQVQERSEPHPAQHFNTAVNIRSPAQLAQVEKIKQQMEEWRRRNQGRDYGREM
ncbi:MAG: relaxase/mobilization nuclease domain-containing protein [Devosia sp.]|nr:relaxase/mobilization nuclease domain-containing protein [Devosia sp.]